MNDPTHVACPHCDAVNRLPLTRLAARPRCGKCHQPLFTAKEAARQSGAMTLPDLLRWVRTHLPPS